MNTFSFRAEAMPDIAELVYGLAAARVTWEFSVLKPLTLPDLAAEIKTDATEEELRQVMHAVPDGHVMVETLRPVPLAENSLERSVRAWPRFS